MPAQRQKVTFTSNGHQLAGLLETPEVNSRGCALFAHCFTCGKNVLAATRISQSLVSLGFSVLRFDFTGLGGSDGDFSNTNFSSNVNDLVAAADYLRENHQAPALLIGHSLGGRAVLSAANRIPEVAAVATIGAPADAAHVEKQFAAHVEEIDTQGKADVSLGGRNFTIEKQFLDDIRNTNDDIEQLRVPLLVMHSPLDTTVSIQQAEHIYRRAKHPKSFITLDTADHLLTDKADAAYAASIISSWSEKYLDSTPLPDAPAEQIEKGEVLIREGNKQFLRVVHTDHHQWLSDEPVNVGGGNAGPDPYEQLLSALGSCTSMTIRMYANHKNLPLDAVNVSLKHYRQHCSDCQAAEENNPRIDVIERMIDLKGDLTPEQRQRLLEIADKCPVHRTLEGPIRITSALVE
ncbi:bifunctional alpha/beta hydrolase/OsmC family protein [Aliamphritea spongicola]|uniref:bifunctional alpha/beta hydrolase/OsmC family protein n=1 Tax=Aliamphritea spongicola TaxID=707589 RepID=UPI00196A289C|nr:bifunctional alpha/beta hydrolase/OsmC family protein [Aliamphritea spongicola]MBN3561022.1 alpha/beta fold hydrolase [Aliamphritea spongicola]